ncbi:MAG: protein phosphatase 2C domain-containing protein [Clostridia bacterium]|nr:protein phosphatase 2C domain-containing protein [Clostridia bacterium]
MGKVSVSAVTLMGNKHRQRGVPCEDASKAVTDNGVSVVCIADGAGGKNYTHARYGAECVVNTITKLLTEHFDAIYNENREAAVKSLILASLHVGFADLMSEHKLDSIERLSCTMLFCAVKDRRVLVGHIGDGLICKVTPSAVVPITMPQNGEDSSHTYFVTANHAADYLRLIKMTTDDCHAICLMTDGVQDSVYNENSGLIKPVMVKLANTLAAGREEAEKSLNNVISEFIVGSSNNSDDASFGVLYFEDTQSVAADKLPNECDEFPRSDDSFKKLQELLLPDVKRARQIIVDAASNAPVEVPTNREAIANSAGASKQASEVDNKLDSNNFRYVNKYTMIALYSIIVILLVLLICLFVTFKRS